MTPIRDHVSDRGSRLAAALVFSLLAFVWAANSSGLISSNDGSHVALARALGVRGETSIDPDRALTLEVDLAVRDGHAYSDRPPGTAFAALPAVWLGDRLDPTMRARAVAQARAGQAIEPLPGPLPYISTYAARVAGGSTGPALVDLIGTSIAAAIQAVLLGLLGLGLIHQLIGRVVERDSGVRLLTVAVVGLATAWGPYSTTLFSHVGAATAVAGFLLGITSLDPGATPDRQQTWIAVWTGLAGAWAVACDYLLLLAIVPTGLLLISWRRWPAVALGAAPIVLATLAYHWAAFGTPFAVGYDHQTNFAFARERGSTFSGGLFDGLWTLWGLGRGAGLLAQSPIVLVGLACLVGFGLAARRRDPAQPVASMLVAAIGFLPWALALGFHRTPWGGGTDDHRYLIPLLPFAAVGLALGWTRANPVMRGLGLALALASTILVWRHFLNWHEVEWFARPELGAAVALPVLLLGVGAAIWPRRAA